MKKKMIAAGAASLALAAMPVVGVFAANGSVNNNGVLTDKLVLTIADNCAFSRGTVASASNKHTVNTETDPIPDVSVTGGGWSTDGSNTDMDIFTAAVLNGQSYTAMATSNFKVVCNNINGYQVTVNPSAFTTSDISNAATWNYNAGGYATGDVSSWYITSNGEGQDMTGDNRTVATKSSATNGSDITVTYNVKVSTTQQAATYNATAAYTFAELPVQQGGGA